MFVWTARISKRLIALLALTAAAFVLLMLILFNNMREDSGASISLLNTNADRIAYLETWGWDVMADPIETLQLLLPEKLQEPYLTYNQLQLEQGFDLKSCCGKQVTRYTYTVTNYPGRNDDVQLNLYVCEDVPVAGDVIASGENGFQAGLSYPQESNG